MFITGRQNYLFPNLEDAHAHDLTRRDTHVHTLTQADSNAETETEIFHAHAYLCLPPLQRGADVLLCQRLAR